MIEASSKLFNNNLDHKTQIHKKNKEDTIEKTKFLSENTINTLKYLMYENTLNGTAKKAKLNGYKIGGKTATGEKAEKGKYDETKLISSFLSVFPIEKPKYISLVLFDEPSLGSVKKYREGARIGHAKMYDHMFLDGLEDAYEEGRLMGSFAEDCARNYQFTRIQQDEYAIKSLENALSAQKMGLFENEIVPVKISKKNKEEILITEDQQPKRSNPTKIPTLKPAFLNDGTVTAANSSSISDGAAALVICSQKYAEEKNLKIKARIKGYTGHAHEPGWFTTAPITATHKLLSLIKWSTEEVDLWEVNEAFAVVPMAFMKELKISREKINVNGGACSLGHPIGASGARILVSLINALKQRDLKKGVAAICIGGGEALAIAIEVD